MYGKPIDSIGFVAEYDAELAAMMNRELVRQQDGIELIASENFASPAVIAAMGSILTNKYAEGLPGKRYYGGCQYVDELEQLCIDRAKALFGAEFANVQPHSGAQANMAVQLALLQPGDTMMGMSLANGGHLSHGSPANLSGKYYNVVSYDVNHETGVEVRIRIELLNEIVDYNCFFFSCHLLYPPSYLVSIDLGSTCTPGLIVVER